MASRNPADLEAALTIGGTYGFSEEHVPVLCRVLHMDWHVSHEDIVRTLQELKDPRAVDAVYKAAFLKPEHLNYDEFFGLARKCTWALADIGTSEALEKLKLLAGSENALIAGYARKRIDNWEKDRKGDAVEASSHPVFLLHQNEGDGVGG